MRGNLGYSSARFHYSIAAFAFMQRRLLSFMSLHGGKHMTFTAKRRPAARACLHFTIAIAGLVASGAFAPLAAYEVPQERSATTFLGALVVGSNYRVAPTVRSDGNMRIFIFNTKYGRFQVDGVDLAKVFIHELKALDALEKISQSETFLNSLGKSAVAPIRYGANLITNPADTVSKSLSGVANMFDRAGQSLSDPDADRASTTDSLLGIDDERRELAIDLGVDPYTNFPPLAQKLTDVASAAAAGGLSVKAALAVVPGGAAVLAVSSISTVQSASDTLRSKTSAQIVEEVKTTLQQLGVSPSNINRLVHNRAYTPTDLLVTARALAKINAQNTDIFISRAADTNSRSVAFFQRRRAELMLARGAEINGVVEFVNVGGFALSRNRTGNVVALLPCDDIAWTAITARAVDAVTRDLPHDGSVVRRPVLATTGSVTPMAAGEFRKLGWEITYLK